MDIAAISIALTLHICEPHGGHFELSFFRSPCGVVGERKTGLMVSLALLTGETENVEEEISG